MRHSFKHMALSLSAFAVVFSAPLTAQDNVPSSEYLAEMFGDAEPLTAEQEARLPAAKAVVERIFPAGTYAKMISESIEIMVGNVLGKLPGSPKRELRALIGVYATQLEGVEDNDVAEALQILDPARTERLALMEEMSRAIISDALAELEPRYRAGLERAYAARFTQSELTDLSAFFATPTGRKYAGQSLAIQADPQMVPAMNEMTPTMMAMMSQLAAVMDDLPVELPEPRSFSDLTEGEQERLAALIGMTTEGLAELDRNRFQVEERDFEEGEVETIDTSDL